MFVSNVSNLIHISVCEKTGNQILNYDLPTTYDEASELYALLSRSERYPQWQEYDIMRYIIASTEIDPDKLDDYIIRIDFSDDMITSKSNVDDDCLYANPNYYRY